MAPHKELQKIQACRRARDKSFAQGSWITAELLNKLTKYTPQSHIAYIGNAEEWL